MAPVNRYDPAAYLQFNRPQAAQVAAPTPTLLDALMAALRGGPVTSQLAGAAQGRRLFGVPFSPADGVRPARLKAPRSPGSSRGWGYQPMAHVNPDASWQGFVPAYGAPAPMAAPNVNPAFGMPINQQQAQQQTQAPFTQTQVSWDPQAQRYVPIMPGSALWVGPLPR